jgi:hypothetical protein
VKYLVLSTVHYRTKRVHFHNDSILKAKTNGVKYSCFTQVWKEIIKRMNSRSCSFLLVSSLRFFTSICTYIPAPLEDARFRKPERIIIKAHFFVKGHSLKNKCNDGYVLLSFPPKGWFINALGG